MNVYLTFDVEIWCGGWDALEERFPASFDRYIYGRSAAGQYALPATLDILARHGVRGIFFVEPLFSRRFGLEHLRRIVDLIQSAGQRIQLHLHPEWCDEIDPPPFPACTRKRQYLSMYSPDEQAELIRIGCESLELAGLSEPVTAFRAGSYAANSATYEALSRNRIPVDSSLNSCFAVSGFDVEPRSRWLESDVFLQSGVTCYPITVLRDGLGRPRPAQVGACSLAELRESMLGAQGAGQREFVVVSHNFEMLKPGSCDPDRFVVRRFDGLCRFLAEERGSLKTASDMPALDGHLCAAPPRRAPAASLRATLRRHVEQALRRLA